MRKLFKLTALIVAAMFIITAPAWSAMSLTSGDQAIRGKKTFEHDAVFNKNVLIKGALLGVSQYSSVFYVDSATGADSPGNYGKTYLKPFATVDFAIGQCTADKGDIIFVMPSHAETFTAADGFDADVAGVTIIGLGFGTDMPTFTFGHADATIAVGAANVTFQNLRFLAGITAITIGIAVEKAGDDFTMEGCVFPEPAASASDFIDAIDLADDTGSASNVRIIGNEYYHTGATGPAHFIEAGNGANSGLQVVENLIYGQFSVAAIWSDTADLNVLIKDNVIQQMTAGEFAIEFTGNATGFIDGNRVYTNAEATSIDPGIMNIGVNYVSTVINASGVVFPAPDDTAENLIGVNDADNAADTSTVAPNEDGSILERLEQIQEGVNIGSGANLPSNKSLFDIIGETYTDDGGADHLDDVYAHLNLIMKYTADGTGGGAAVGAGLPTGKSLFDILGDEYTDDGGNDNLDSVAAHLNLLSKYIADGDGDFATGTALASNKSIADALGTNGTTPVDSGTSVLGAIGVDDADNLMATTSVVSNPDGSLFERLEYLQKLQEILTAKQLMSVAAAGLPIAVWYVDGTTGGDGKSPGTAFATIDLALAACSNAVDDWILVQDYSGSAATITINKSNVHLIGQVGSANPYPRIKAATGHGITAAAVDNVEIAGFTIGAASDSAAIYVGFSIYPNRWYIHDNVFGIGASSLAQEGILVASDGDLTNSRIEDNTFRSAVTQEGIQIEGNATRTEIRNNIFLNLTASDAYPAISLVNMQHGIIEGNRIFGGADDGAGWAITVGAGSDYNMFNLNYANDANVAITNAPFLDGGTNFWGLNYEDKTAVLPD